MNRDMFPDGQCPECGMYGGQWINGKHTCTKYEGPPCATCGEPTVFVVVAAPGTGQGWTCKANHFHGYVRELTLDDVR